MKPIASLSIDLDNEWSYLKVHGEEIWRNYPTYLPVAVPRILSFFRQQNQKLTFFIVGRDATIEANRECLGLISADGHEIGNHSFNHEPWLHLYSVAEIEEEFENTENALVEATGQKPIGFRGPGFSLSRSVLECLHRRGYKYDCSTFPTYLGPLARLYYFMTAKLTPDEKEERKKLFGKLSEGLRPLKPYRWSLAGGDMTEIPVTTLPIFKTPFHVSYLHYLACFSESLAVAYFKTALAMCRWTGVQPSLLLHPLDFLGGDDVASLAFFPAMNVDAATKLRRMDRFLSLYQSGFDVRPMRDHAEWLDQNGPLPLRDPNFEERAAD